MPISRAMLGGKIPIADEQRAYALLHEGMLPGTAAGAFFDSLLLQVYAADQTDHADDDQICRDDIVEQPGRDQNKHAGDQGNQWSKTQVDIHCVILCA